MGAKAYATGNHVAFQQQPDLHTAAHEAAHVVQGATVLTLLVSSYLVIFRYPSPIAISARLRRD
mgnify:CR=1 FL=1